MMSLFRTAILVYVVATCVTYSGVASSPVLYFHKHNDTDTAVGDANDYFHELCDDFLVCKRGKQFGVLTIGEIKNNAFNPPKPEDEKRCKDFVDNAERHLYNYNVAQPITKKKQKHVHSEEQLLRDMNKMDAWKGSTDVYLFTFLSPCKGCADNIVKVMKSNQGLHMHLSWQVMYHKIEILARDFFQSLEILFGANQDQLTVHWKNDKKKCGEFQRVSYQYLFYSCLKDSNIKIKNCNNPTQDFSKFVNKLTFTCIEHLGTYSDQLTECINKFFAQYVSNTDKTTFDGCKPDKNTGDRPFVGPPLKPNDPIFGSQSLDDLHGTYTDFCFDKKN